MDAIRDGFKNLDDIPIKIGSKQTTITNTAKLHPHLENSNLGITLLLMKYTAQGAADRNYYPEVQDYMVGKGFQETVIGDTFLAAVQTLLISKVIERKDLPSANIRNSELHKAIIANQDQLRAYAFVLDCIPGSDKEIESWPPKLAYQIENAPKRQGKTTAELRKQAKQSVGKFFDMVHEETDNIALLDTFKSPQEVAVYLYAAVQKIRTVRQPQAQTRDAVLAFAEILSQQTTQQQASEIAQLDMGGLRKIQKGSSIANYAPTDRSILGQIEKLRNTAELRSFRSANDALSLALQYLSVPVRDLSPSTEKVI